MKTPHKHAEVTIAWLQDQSSKLEFKRLLPGAVWEVTYGLMNPIANPDFEWRIKPEPKPDRVSYRSIYEDSLGLVVSTKHTVNNLKLTFSGETGKLKAAEVIS